MLIQFIQLQNLNLSGSILVGYSRQNFGGIQIGTVNGDLPFVLGRMETVRRGEFLMV